VWVILAFVSLVAGCWICTRYLLIGKRAERELEDLYRELGAKNLPFDTFCKVITTLGECYKINPKKLRLSDSFIENLAAIDSWTLGNGNECFSRYLQESFGSFQVTPKSIADLLVLISSRLYEHHP